MVIGGNGSLTGGLRLSELGVKVVGIPATIDNDVWGTDIAIGVDTALNTALEAIDRIKDTASSHNRAHVVEVMGRDCGYLALTSAIAGGAEAVLVPEFEPDPEDLIGFIKKAYEQGKSHFVVVAAEGAKLPAAEFHEYVNSTGTYESRLTVVGHAQRGGDPHGLRPDTRLQVRHRRRGGPGGGRVGGHGRADGRAYGQAAPEGDRGPHAPPGPADVQDGRRPLGAAGVGSTLRPASPASPRAIGVLAVCLWRLSRRAYGVRGFTGLPCSIAE